MKKRQILAVLLFMLLPLQGQARYIDSQSMANYEIKMWQAYYNKQYVRLGRELLQFFSHQFDIELYDAFWLSYYASKAARHFSMLPRPMNKARAEQQIMPDLLAFYQRLKEASDAKWEAKAAAQAELNWWLSRRTRQGANNPKQVGQAIAKLYGVLHGKMNSCLLKAGTLRAMAANQRDRQSRAGNIDWSKVKKELQRAYYQLFLGLLGCDKN